MIATWWLIFISAAVLTVICGKLLSDVGEKLAIKLELSSGFVGFLFLAAATSLPELSSAIGAVAVVKQPDIAVSDMLGSNVFNLFSIAIVDLATSVPYTAAFENHRFANSMLGFASLMTAIVLVAVAVSSRLPLTFGTISFYAFLLFVVYLLALRNAHQEEEYEEEVEESLTKIIVEFVVLAAIIFVCGIALAKYGDKIADHYGWGKSFIGGLFIAIVTSLPEVSVSVPAAIRGNLDMAVGNLIGSNIFNLAIIGVVDIFWKGSIFSALSLKPTLILAAAGIFNASIVILMLEEALPRTKRFEWGSLVLLIGYLLSSYLIYIVK